MDEQQKNPTSRDVAPTDEGAGQREQSRGISPLNPSSMPRAEDDEQTYANSPEYHDRVANEPSKSQPAAQSKRYAPEGTTKPPDAVS